MINKKITALVLSGAILAGGIGLGTYSWFTSNANSKANLKIHTGTLKVATNDENAHWIVKGNTEAKAGKEITKLNFDNVRPGDSFEKIVEIKNTGSLDERLTFKVNDKVETEYSGAVDVKVEALSGGELKRLVLKNGTHIKAKITVKIKENANNDWQDKEIDLSKVIGNENLIEVNGTQVNAPIKAVNTEKTQK